MPTAKDLPDFGTATPTFGPAAQLPTASEAGQHPAGLRPSHVRGEGQEAKYGNRKVECDGKLFHSRHEAKVYRQLQTLQVAGMIRGLETQVPFQLLGYDGSCVYTWTADFVYLNTIVGGIDLKVVADAKSGATRKKDTWRVIRKLFRATYGFDITEL